MKKNLCFLILFFLLCVSSSPVFCAEEQASLAHFPILFNGESVDNEHAEFPILVYKDMTYFPLSNDFISALGMKSTFTNEKGLQLHKFTHPAAFVMTAGSENDLNKAVDISIPTFPIRLNGDIIDNANEFYPVFLYKDIAYFPLNWDFAVKEFNLLFSDSANGELLLSTTAAQYENRIHTADSVDYRGGDGYYGEFSEGKRDGHGLYMWADRTTYSGDWLQGDMHGIGTFTFPDGTFYTGEFYYGSFQGQGKKEWTDGAKAIGQWENDDQNGLGKYVYEDGTVYEGMFKDGLFCGEGTMTYEDGLQISGIWENDEIIKPLSDIPSGLTAKALSINEIEVNWNPVYGCDYYHLYYAGRKGGPWIAYRNKSGSKSKLDCSTGPDAILYDCKPGQKIYFKVASVTDKVESECSEIIWTKTFAKTSQAAAESANLANISVESKIISNFGGLKEGNAYTLENGQVWKQISDHYAFRHIYRPGAIIYKEHDQYKMRIDGCSQDIIVEEVISEEQE